MLGHAHDRQFASVTCHQYITQGGNFLLSAEESHSIPPFTILGQQYVIPNILSNTFPSKENRAQVHHEKLEQATIKLSQLCLLRRRYFNNSFAE